MGDRLYTEDDDFSPNRQRKLFKPTKPLNFLNEKTNLADEECMLYEIDPSAKEAILKQNIDPRGPMGLALGTFLLRQLDSSPSATRQWLYFGAMAMGVGLSYYAIQRELTTMSIVERIALHRAGQ